MKNKPEQSHQHHANGRDSDVEFSEGKSHDESARPDAAQFLPTIAPSIRMICKAYCQKHQDSGADRVAPIKCNHHALTNPCLPTKEAQLTAITPGKVCKPGWQIPENSSRGNSLYLTTSSSISGSMAKPPAKNVPLSCEIKNNGHNFFPVQFCHTVNSLAGLIVQHILWRLPQRRLRQSSADVQKAAVIS